MLYPQERRQVLAAAREISETGLVIGTWGNVSIRCQGQNLMIITPSGMNYGALAMEDMVLVNGDLQILEGNFKPSTEVVLHMGVYKNRPDVQAIVHTHSLYAAAFAAAGKSLPVILEEMAQMVGHEVTVAEYGLCGSDALAINVINALGQDRQAVLLAHHGLITVGSSMDHALKRAHIIEKTSQVYLLAQALGGVKQIPEQDINSLHESFKNYGQEK